MIKTNTITISASPDTITIPVESSQDIHYIIAGTHAMGGAISIAATGALTNAKLTFYYTATLTSYSIGSNYLQFPGSDKLPAEYAAKECKIECIYNGSAWKAFFFPGMEGTDIIFKSQIGDDAVGNDELDSTSTTEAVNTNVIRDGAVTLVKMADIADDTILGNVYGGAAEPAALTATEVRTLLDQDITLTGHITGTATQTFATGDTSISTTLANNVVTVAMLTNTVATELPPIPISFESGALTAGSAYIAVKMPYAATIEEYGVSVTELIEGTDDATVTIYNTAGVLMGTSSVTVTKGTKPSTTAAGGSFFNSSSITSDNSISAAALFYIRVQKVTAGGRAFANIKVKRA
jgi:hypothetical protein